MVMPTGAKVILAAGMMSACAQGAPRVSNIAGSSVSLVSGFRFLILLVSFLFHRSIPETEGEVPNEIIGNGETKEIGSSTSAVSQTGVAKWREVSVRGSPVS